MDRKLASKEDFTKCVAREIRRKQKDLRSVLEYREASALVFEMLATQLKDMREEIESFERELEEKRVAERCLAHHQDMANLAEKALERLTDVDTDVSDKSLDDCESGFRHVLVIHDDMVKEMREQNRVYKTWCIEQGVMKRMEHLENACASLQGTLLELNDGGGTR